MNCKLIIKIALTVCLLSLASVLLGQTLEPKLYLSFDEGQGNVCYDEVSDLKAELTNIKWGKGRFGNAVYFNGIENRKSKSGASSIALPQTGKIAYFQNFDNKPFSLAMWFKPSSKKPWTGAMELINTGADFGPGYRLTYTNRLMWFLSGDGTKANHWKVKTIPSKNPVINDAWNHVAVTKDGNGVISLFLNGKKAGSSNKTLEVSKGTWPMNIGSYDSGHAYTFQGGIDEFSIFSGAKNHEQILIDYLAVKKDSSIKLDGVLNEKIWQGAKKFPLQADKKESDMVFITSDNQFLYIGFSGNIPEGTQPKLEIMIDADKNALDYHHFILPASGQKSQFYRDQGGFVKNQWNNHFWYTAVSRNNGTLNMEAAIPLAILNLENNLLDNINMNVVVNSQSTSASILGKGITNKPAKFENIKLARLDSIDKYNFRMENIRLKTVLQDKENLKAVISFQIKNNSAAKLSQTLDLFLISKDGTQVVSDSLNLSLKPGEEKELESTFKINGPGSYKLLTVLKEKNHVTLLNEKAIKIFFVPLSINVVQPFYRNSIYSTEKIKKIKAKINFFIPKNEQNKYFLAVKLFGPENDLRYNQVYKQPKLTAEYEIPAENLPEGKCRLEVKLLDSQEKEMAENNVTLHVLPAPKGNEVRIDNKLNIILNGKPFLPIFWWTRPPYVKLKQTGADGVITCLVGAEDANRKILDQLLENQMYTIVMPWDSSIKKQFWFKDKKLSEKGKRLLTKKIKEIMDHKAVMGYYLADEPEAKGYNADLVKQTYELIREIDPYHPVFICNHSISGMETFKDALDIFIPDPYPWPQKNGFTRPLSYMTHFLDQAYIIGKNRKSVGVTPQLFSKLGKNDRAPTYSELRCMQFSAIIHGAKAFSLFMYDSNPGEFIGAAEIPDLSIGSKYITSELLTLSPIVLNGEKIKTGKISQNNIHYLLLKFKGHYFLFAANISPNQINAELDIPWNGKLSVISENRDVSSVNSRFTDTFEPYSAHIYTSNLDFGKQLVPISEIKSKINKKK